MEIKFLKSIPFFSHLSDEKLEVILQACEQKSFQKDDLLMEQSDPGNGMYVVMFGEVEVLVNGEKVAALGPNDFFGEIALIASTPRTATVRVASDTLSAIFLSKEAFDTVKDSLGEEIFAEVYRRIEENEER